jgi:hypothetical protein
MYTRGRRMNGFTISLLRYLRPFRTRRRLLNHFLFYSNKLSLGETYSGFLEEKQGEDDHESWVEA